MTGELYLVLSKQYISAKSSRGDTCRIGHEWKIGGIADTRKQAEELRLRCSRESWADKVIVKIPIEISEEDAKLFGFDKSESDSVEETVKPLLDEAEALRSKVRP